MCEFTLFLALISTQVLGLCLGSKLTFEIVPRLRLEEKWESFLGLPIPKEIFKVYGQGKKHSKRTDTANHEN